MYIHMFKKSRYKVQYFSNCYYFCDQLFDKNYICFSFFNFPRNNNNLTKLSINNISDLILMYCSFWKFYSIFETTCIYSQIILLRFKIVRSCYTAKEIDYISQLNIDMWNCHWKNCFHTKLRERKREEREKEMCYFYYI